MMVTLKSDDDDNCLCLSDVQVPAFLFLAITVSFVLFFSLDALFWLFVNVASISMHSSLTFFPGR